MRRYCVAAVFSVLIVAAFLVPYYIVEYQKQRAMEFVKNYKGTDGNGVSIVDFISATDIGCGCDGSVQLSRSWAAEPHNWPRVWKVTSWLETPLTSSEITFYTDMVTVWPGDEEAKTILSEIEARSFRGRDPLVLFCCQHLRIWAQGFCCP